MNGVSVDEHGRFAVTVSADRTARVWSLASEKCMHVLRGHGVGVGTGVIYGVDLSPDHRRAVTCSDDLTLRVWDLSSGLCERVLVGHTGYVVDVKILPNGASAVSASHDGTARYGLEPAGSLKYFHPPSQLR